MTSPARKPMFNPILCVVDFHHARGPECEHWIGVAEEDIPLYEKEWNVLPFMALTDGAHAFEEDFSYFSLRHEDKTTGKPTSVFGLSCERQIKVSELTNPSKAFTRSSVQKAVVVIAGSPVAFGHVKERLGVVTQAWFAQKEFTDIEILQRFQESLARTFREQEDERDQYFGMSLRQLIHEYKHQTLVLLKCLLLQPKMVFFGSNCERLCLMQFSLISLIPGLIRHLQDCSDPDFNTYEEDFVPPSSLKTSDRASLLAYMGLPLQIFGKGSMFGPYTPLQQLDDLLGNNYRSYVVGSTNALVLQQKDKYADLIINLDDKSINVTSTSLRTALTLSTPDRRWIDVLTQNVNDTWDDTNPNRPKTMGYLGSEEFIRLQFEEYLLALLSSIKYKQYLQKHEASDLLTDIEGDPSAEFGADWIEAWQKTENYRLFSKFTDSHIFDIVDPKHPCSGGLTIDDVQRRLAQQVSDLHLDEKVQASREALGKQFAAGQKRVSTAINDVWAGLEARREAQHRKREEEKAEAAKNGLPPPGHSGYKRPDFSQAQANLQAASSRAGAYFSSWGAWASEKRKQGWGSGNSGNRSSSTNSTPLSSPGFANQEFKDKDEKRGINALVSPRQSVDVAGKVPPLTAGGAGMGKEDRSGGFEKVGTGTGAGGVNGANGMAGTGAGAGAGTAHGL